MKWVNPFFAMRDSDAFFTNDFGEKFLKVKDFSRSHTVTYTGKVIISRKR